MKIDPYKFIQKVHYKNLRRFKITRFTGIITDITKQSKEHFMAEYGSLRIEVYGQGEYKVFWTKIRKGQKLRVGQKVTFFTLKNPSATAWRYSLNVVKISVDDVVIYKWDKRVPLYIYDGCGNG